MSKQKVVFTQDVEVLAQGKVEFSAEAGDVVALEEASAQRWIRRGKAVTEETFKERQAAEKAAGKKAEQADDAELSADDVDSLTVDELKAALDEREIEYTSEDRKDDLRVLLLDALTDPE